MTVSAIGIRNNARAPRPPARLAFNSNHVEPDFHGHRRPSSLSFELSRRRRCWPRDDAVVSPLERRVASSIPAWPSRTLPATSPATAAVAPSEAACGRSNFDSDLMVATPSRISCASSSDDGGVGSDARREKEQRQRFRDTVSTTSSQRERSLITTSHNVTIVSLQRFSDKKSAFNLGH